MCTDHLYVIVYCATLAGYYYYLEVVLFLLRVFTVSYFGKIESRLEAGDIIDRRSYILDYFVLSISLLLIDRTCHT